MNTTSNAPTTVTATPVVRRADAPGAELAGPPAVRRPDPPSVELTRHLLQYFLSGQVAPGQKIASERQLAAALGVGRSGVREAIKSLSLLGLLEVRQGDGTYITGSASNLLPEVVEWGLLLGEQRILDLVEVREHLEVFIAGLAAERHTPDDVAALQAAVETMSGAGSDVSRYIKGDYGFHRALAQATGNEVLISLSHSFRALLQVWSARCVEEERDTARLAAEHQPIVRAVERANANAARAAMAKHMKTANARLVRALPADARV
jgi:GntR family transcriptional regulator, transcriptional repressor for pyruvate dehydrogenase complex